MHFLSSLVSAINPLSVRGLRHACFLLAIACVLLGMSDAQAGLKIYYIRHAEGGHNVTGDWVDVPEEQWPAYVGDPNAFTPKGEVEVQAATEKLQKYHFDFIAVSPLWRARNTILPYLQKTGTKGEIWPELHEMYASHLILNSDLPSPTVKILDAGKPVELPPEEAPYFLLRKDGMNQFKLPTFPKDHTDMEGEAAAARVILQRVVDLIQKRFGGTEKSILLVGHGSSGKGILRILTKNRQSGVPSGIANTGIWMVEEQPNGEFELKMYNDERVENGRVLSAQGQ